MTHDPPQNKLEVFAAAGGVALFVAVAASAAFSGCGGRTGEARPDRTKASVPAVTSDASSPPVVWDDDDASPPDLGPLPDAAFDPSRFDSGPPPDAGAAPVVACVDAGDDDAGDGGAAIACPLPPSVCLNGYWLLSYANGTCRGATCAYVPILFDCSQGGWWVHCGDGACRVTNPE